MRPCDAEIGMVRRQSVLELIARTRPGYGSHESGATYKTERRFLDFVVDGVSLYDSMAGAYDFASVLWIDAQVHSEALNSVRRLLLLDPGDLPSGRVSLYTCAECGDLGCGGLTANVFVDGAEVIWCDFGYENNYDGTVELERFRSYGPFHFDRRSYEARLTPLLSQYA